jgi:hypothetical protein
MADVVVKSLPVKTNSEPTFPQQITVNDQKERDSWLVPGTTSAALDAIADVMDIFCCNTEFLIEYVNNLTYAQIQKALSDREV